VPVHTFTLGGSAYNDVCMHAWNQSYFKSKSCSLYEWI
jgi:hypothetical protein